jgi:hypothetical protein
VISVELELTYLAFLQKEEITYWVSGAGHVFPTGTPRGLGGRLGTGPGSDVVLGLEDVARATPSEQV